MNAAPCDHVLNLLQGKLDKLHRQGNELHAACPHCQDGDDRFFTGPKYNYNLWHCRICGHTTTTAALAGLDWTANPRPAVKAWAGDDGPDPLLLGRIRSLYASLTEHAQAALITTPRAQVYLAGRGLDLATMASAGLGYLDTPTYLAWRHSLSDRERATLRPAGLPDPSGERLTGFNAAFAGGRQGKIFYPYFDESGQVVDVRTRSISPQDRVRYMSPRLPLAERGALVPYGVETLGKAARVVLTEGEFKRLVPLAAGLPWPVLSLRGTSDPVASYLPYLHNRFVVLAFDNDASRDKQGVTAGEAATVKIGRLLRAHGVAAGVVDPQWLVDQKGIDDYANAYGRDALAALVRPGATLTLAEFEAQLERRGATLSGFVKPRADIGTVKQWTPAPHVDVNAHVDTETATLAEAQRSIEEATRAHFQTYKRGNDQLLITTAPGTGKTTITLAVARAHAAETGKTLAYVAPNHAMIDEKIGDGTLPADTVHVYGMRWDEDPEGIHNCQQADTAQTLLRYGYSPGMVLCPTCPALKWCRQQGYKAQFQGKANRAYVHAHLHTDYPGGEDLVVVDELTHKAFIEELGIFVGDLANTLQLERVGGGQRDLLEALLKLYTAPDLNDVDGAEFYELFHRFYPDLPNVDVWGDGSSVQMALHEVALAFSQDANPWAAEHLPQQFAARLFAIFSEDVRRLNAGRMPTGRVRLVCPGTGKPRRLILTFSKGALPGWYGKRPTVILNATADATTLDDLAGPMKLVAPVVTVKEGNEIVQDVTRNHAKSGLVGDSPDAQKRRAAWLDEIRAHMDDEADTTIVTTKALAAAVMATFPQAKVSYYGALEGRNDLQAGTTILANAPAVNVRAVQMEAAALYPGIDTTLTRSTVAFDEQNAGGDYLAVEQLDAVDPRLQALLWQHRDAAVIQAVHRARLVRESGRKVVVLFSRPIPGLRPTQTITERATVSKAAQQTSATLDRLLAAAKTLIDANGAFSRPMLMAAAGAHHTTVDRHWERITSALALNWFDLPAVQTLANGARRSASLRMALPASTVEEARSHVRRGRYQNLLISLAPYVQSCIPASWQLDLPVPPAPDPEAAAALPSYFGRLLERKELAEALHLAKRARIEVDPLSLDWGRWRLSQARL